MSELDELIQEKIHNVRDMDDYVMIRILLACRQERDKNWYEPLCGDEINEKKLYETFMYVKLLLRRIEFELDDDKSAETIAFFEKNAISPYLIYDIIHVNFLDENRMQSMFSDTFFRFCGDDKYRSEFMEHARRVEFYDIEV